MFTPMRLQKTRPQFIGVTLNNNAPAGRHFFIQYLLVIFLTVDLYLRVVAAFKQQRRCTSRWVGVT